MLLSVLHSSKSACARSPGSRDSQRPRHTQPSMTHSCESSRAHAKDHRTRHASDHVHNFLRDLCHNDWSQFCKEQNLPIPPGSVYKDLIRAPIKRQERQISIPGPKGTADTEIGRHGLQYLGRAFSRTTLSPAKVHTTEASLHKIHHDKITVIQQLSRARTPNPIQQATT